MSDFLRHVDRVEDGVHLDADAFARALNRFLRLDLSHPTLLAVIQLAEKSAGGEVRSYPYPHSNPNPHEARLLRPAAMGTRGAPTTPSAAGTV